MSPEPKDLRRPQAISQGLQLSWFCCFVSGICIARVVCQIKAICLICLARDNIFLSFLDSHGVYPVSAFSPSPGHASHPQVQTSLPMGTCSFLADASAAGAVVPWL